MMSNILIFLSVISVCRAQCGSPTNQTNPMFTNVQDAINLIGTCDFPNDKFNASCVKTGCPELVTPGLCPYTSTKNLNLTALNAILTVLNSCFRQQPSICSTPLASMPLPPMAVGLTQVFADLPFGGQCFKTPNTGLFYNVQNVSFSISPGQKSSPGPLNVTIDAPSIALNGGAQCSISIGSTDDPALSLHLPNINFTISIAATLTGTIDFSADQPVVRVQADKFNVNIQLMNFAPVNSVIQLPAGVQDLFAAGMTLLWKMSEYPTVLANFYATFVAFGIEAAKGNCPSL